MGLGDLLYMFRNQPDRVLVAGLVLSLIDTILMLPLNYWTIMTSPEAQTLDAQVSWLQTAMALLVLGMVLGVIFKIPLVLTFYLLADNGEPAGREALKTPVRLMRGKKWNYMVLELRVLPVIIFSAFTLYIAFLWLLPYMQAVETAFYMDALGEFDRPQPEEYPENSLPEIHLEDDYNAEA